MTKNMPIILCQCHSKFDDTFFFTTHILTPKRTMKMLCYKSYSIDKNRIPKFWILDEDSSSFIFIFFLFHVQFHI